MERPSGLLSELGFHGLQALEAPLLCALVTGEPLLLVGRHGTAKTALCRRLAEALALRFHAYDASKALFEDVLGFPSPASLSAGRVEYVPTPISLWDQELVLVDELSRAQPQMQSKWLEVIRSRCLMGRALPALRYVLAAMNPAGYDGVYPLDEALASRFAIVLAMPDALDLPDADCRRVIASLTADDAPLLHGVVSGLPPNGARLRALRVRLRRRIASLRGRLPAIDRRDGPALVTYVHRLGRELADQGFALDGRRLGMIRRNLLVALALAGRRPGRTAAAEAMVRCSLPFGLTGGPAPTAEVLDLVLREARAALPGEPGAPPARRRDGAAPARLLHLSAAEQLHAVVDALRLEHEAAPERLGPALRSLVDLAGAMAAAPGRVAPEAVERLHDELAVRLGLVDLGTAELLETLLRADLESGSPAELRLARRCLVRAASGGRPDPSAAAALLGRATARARRRS
jgi:hypothetical protein